MPRASNQSKMAHIRLEEPLMNALRRRAKACGMSVAELHRFALRRVLGMVDGTPTDYSQASQLRLSQLTANGDLFACREMQQRYIALALAEMAEGAVNRACEFLSAAAQFGGIASYLGDASDEREMARIVLLRARLARLEGETSFADKAQSQSMAILDGLADAGVAGADDYLQAAATVVPPHVLHTAAQIRAEARK